VETEKPSSFGALVRHYRQLRDWSQEEVADKAGISLRTLNELERDGVVNLRTVVGSPAV